jgi:hypothetical protein
MFTNHDPDLLTPPGLAWELRVSESTVRRYHSEKKIEADFIAWPWGVALFRKSRIEELRAIICPQPPATPDAVR